MTIFGVTLKLKHEKRIKMLILSFFDAADTLFFFALFLQRTIATTCSSSCNGSSDGVLGDRAIPTKFNG